MSKESILSVPLTDGWQMQWRRVERGFAKLNPAKVCGDTELYDDDIYHFFQDAWHLKDWIKNDPALSSHVRDQIEDKVHDIRSLRIAADFTNGTKHMLLDKRNIKRRPENAQFTERKVTLPLGSGSASSVQVRVLTLCDGSTTTAEIEAGNVMQEWRVLLQSLGLMK